MHVKYECFVVQMLYVCVLCAFCVSAHCILHDLLMLVEEERGDHMEEAYSRIGLI